MIIGRIEYQDKTSRITETIDNEFSRILEGNGKPEDITSLLSQYPILPGFVRPYLLAVYYKCFNDLKKAVSLIDEAISLLQSDKICHSSKDLFDCSTYHFIYEPFVTVLWPQAAEIYAEVDRFTDSVKAYKQYLLLLCQAKSNDVSGGLMSFRPINKYTLSDLINNQLTVCNPRVMNDPYDTLLLSWGDYHLKNKQGRKYVEPYLKAMDYFRIRSFSKISKRDVYPSILSNVLMWSHYADNHYGMCVEYLFSKEFTKKHDDGVLRFWDVKYQPKDKMISLDTSEIKIDTGLLTKKDEWEYEEEVRLVSYLPNTEGQFVPIKLDQSTHIRNIYFGIRCPDRDIATVRGILCGQDIHFYQMKNNPKDVFNPFVVPLD